MNPQTGLDSPENHRSTENRRAFAKQALGAVLLVGSVAAFAFEQSPLNEGIRAKEAIEVIREGGNEIEAGLTVAGITMAVELGASALIIAGINQKGGVMNSAVSNSRIKKQRRAEARAERKLQKSRKGLLPEDVPADEASHPEQVGQAKTTETPSKFKSALEYMGVSLGVGAGIVVIDEKMKTDKPSIKKDILHAAAASTLISAVSGTIGYLGTGGIRHLEDTPLEWPAEQFVKYATDFKFWAVVLSPIMLTRFGRWVADVRRERKEAAGQLSFLTQESILSE